MKRDKKQKEIFEWFIYIGLIESGLILGKSNGYDLNTFNLCIHNRIINLNYIR